MMTLEPPRGMAGEADPWKTMGVSRAGLGRYLRTAQSAVGLRGEIHVLLADDRTLRRLNREWRGKDEATDVLSFPASPELAGRHAGDLAVSLETAQAHAVEQGHSLRDELRILLLHGLLHLAGMDHETDHGEMAAREAELRGMLRLKPGLIARADESISRFPAGMTERKATAKTNTVVLRSAQDDGEKRRKRKKVAA